jgi:hypothetical protein
MCWIGMETANPASVGAYFQWNRNERRILVSVCRSVLENVPLDQQKRFRDEAGTQREKTLITLFLSAFSGRFSSADAKVHVKCLDGSNIASKFEKHHLSGMLNSPSSRDISGCDFASLIWLMKFPKLRTNPFGRKCRASSATG